MDPAPRIHTGIKVRPRSPKGVENVARRDAHPTLREHSLTKRKKRKKSDRIELRVAPGAPEFTYEGERFRIAQKTDGVRCHWHLYGGESGNVIAYKHFYASHPRSGWYILARTRKAHGYYFVSTENRGKRWQPYVHLIILLAFKGQRTCGGAVGRHLDDDPTNNSAANLVWGTQSENALDAHEHRRARTTPGTKEIPVYVPRETVEKLRDAGVSNDRLRAVVAEVLVRWHSRLISRPTGLTAVTAR